MTEKEITIEIKYPEIIILTLVLLTVFAFELNVSINSPIAFGDEGYHTIIAKYLAEAKEYPVWLPMFGTAVTKSGLTGTAVWNLAEAGFFLIFGFHDFIVKTLVPLIASVLVGFTVFIIGKKIYDQKIGFLASVMVVTVPSLVTYSVLMYKDSFFILYFGLAILTFLLAVNTDKKKYWLLFGIFSALCMMVKVEGYAIFPLMALTFLYQIYTKKNPYQLIKNYIIPIIFFVLIMGPFFLRELIYFNTPACNLPLPGFSSNDCAISDYKDTYQYEGRTEQTGTELNVMSMGLMNYLDFAFGILWFIPLLFICGIFTLTRRMKQNDILMFFILISFIPVFYIGGRGRAEDTARYTLGLIYPISLIGANYLKELYDFLKKYLKIGAMIIFILIIVVSFFNLNTKLTAARRYDSGSGTYVGYKMFSPLFFEACDWIKENLPNDVRLGAVIWQSATAINCQRNVGGGGGDVLLSQNLTLAITSLKIQNITHIFIQKFSISWTDQKLTERYPISFINFLEENPKNFKKIYENGPSLEQCKQMGGCDGTILYEVLQ